MLYELLTGYRQFPETDALQRGRTNLVSRPKKRDQHPAKRGEMSAAELQERPDVEIEIVEQWRAQSLLRAGYDPEAAVVLAASHEIDLHYAMSLVERGCPVDLALQILL
jgi:hypothetical protein